MTTAGELLRALSGLQSATAAEHLLAVDTRQGGTSYPVFGARFSVATSESRDWVIDSEQRTYLFIEDPQERIAATSTPVVTASSAVARQALSTHNDDLFTKTSVAQTFLHTSGERASIFTRVQ